MKNKLSGRVLYEESKKEKPTYEPQFGDVVRLKNALRLYGNYRGIVARTVAPSAECVMVKWSLGGDENYFRYCPSDLVLIERPAKKEKQMEEK